MKALDKFVFLLLGSLALASCARPSVEYSDQFLALGTIVTVTLYDVDSTLAKQAVHDVKQHLLAFTHQWHAWGDGKLGNLNRALHQGGCETVELDLVNAIKSAQLLSRDSGNRFDPGIGSLTELWQFHVEERPELPPPSADDVAALVAANFSVFDTVIRDGAVCASKAGLWLDLGGFAKGIAVDESIQVLQSYGITNAIVNAGGDLRAIGRHGDRPWVIGIRNPDEEGYVASVEVSGDESVFTSGDYERWFEWDGKRYHHILDPATGYPASELRSVTIIGADAATADAAATALFVAGKQAWPAVAANLGVKTVLVVTTEGEYQSTTLMARRVKLENNPGISIVIRSLP